MSKKTRVILAAVLAALTALGGCGARTAGHELDTPYEYPLTPGTKEWLSCSVDERWERLQIPEDVLDRLTTRALAETVVNFPLLPDIFAASDMRYGYESMSKKFNGLRELENRDGGLDALYEVLSADSADELGDQIYRDAAWAILSETRGEPVSHPGSPA